METNWMLPFEKNDSRLRILYLYRLLQQHAQISFCLKLSYEHPAKQPVLFLTL